MGSKHPANTQKLNKKRKYPETVKNQFSKFNDNIINLEKITGKIRDYNKPSTERQAVIFQKSLNENERKKLEVYLEEIKDKYNKPIENNPTKNADDTSIDPEKSLAINSHNFAFIIVLFVYSSDAPVSI